MMFLGLLLTVLALSAAQNETQPRQAGKRAARANYVCPPHFLRLRHKCYYFSDKVATWQDAYFECRSLKSNLAIIRNGNQDKFIKRTLAKKEPAERWLGGVYDWEQMMWKWAASGKPVVYQGFSRIENDKEKLRWHCITVDPALNYKWNSKSCLEEKKFICHTKIKAPRKKGKKKLQQLYSSGRYNNLNNEIPVPDLPNSYYNFTTLKANRPNGITLEIGNDLGTEFARPAEKRKRKVKHRKRIQHSYPNGTVAYDIPPQVLANRRRRYRYRDQRKELAYADPRDLKWRSYYQEEMKNPLYPKKIIEEYNFVKEGTV